MDKPFTETSALMRAPDGNTITQFELHDLEDLGLIKYDILSVEAADKIQVCLELLIEYGYVKAEKTLKETYKKVIGVYNLERNDPKMWEMVWNQQIVSLFQMEQQSGVQGIALTKPKTVDELASLNSAIRLMPQGRGQEQPLQKYARFKENLSLWDEEMIEAGLTEKERDLLHKELDISFGLSISQEQFMNLVQIPEVGGMSFQWSDRLRKSIAKKSAKEYEALEKEYYDNIEKKQLSYPLCNYVWRVLIAMNRGYGFEYLMDPLYSNI